MWPTNEKFSRCCLMEFRRRVSTDIAVPPPIYPQIYQTFHKHAFPSSLVLPRETSQLVLRLHVEHTSNSGV